MTTETIILTSGIVIENSYAHIGMKLVTTRSWGFHFGAPTIELYAKTIEEAYAKAEVIERGFPGFVTEYTQHIAKWSAERAMDFWECNQEQVPSPQLNEAALTSRRHGETRKERK